jgi:hypothetical protein
VYVARPVRICLDTAILLDRADGKWSPELVERFDDAVIRSAAYVVITVSHLWDIHASASPAGRERAIAAIEKMPNLRGVVVSPPQVEDPRIDAAMTGQSVEEVAPDIALGEVPDLAEVVAETAPGFFALAGAGAGMAEGGNISRQASGPEGDEAVVAEFFRRLVSGESVTDFLKTLNMNDESMRAAIAQLATLEPMAEQWRPVVQKELDRVGGDPRTLVRVLRKTRGSPADVGWSSTEKGEQRWYETARRYGPGMYVSRRLSKIRASNPRRNIKPSDLADVDLVTYLPYMDFATVDKENHAAVQQVLGELLPPATVRLYRNGDFAELVDAVEACL